MDSVTLVTSPMVSYKYTVMSYTVQSVYAVVCNIVQLWTLQPENQYPVEGEARFAHSWVGFKFVGDNIDKKISHPSNDQRLGGMTFTTSMDMLSVTE